MHTASAERPTPLAVKHARLRANIATQRLLMAATWLRLLTEKANFDPGQPRIPAGDPAGGQWTGGGGSGNSTESHRTRLAQSGHNNKLAQGWGQNTDSSKWTYVTRVDDNQSAITVDAGSRIAVEASSIAYPPTNQFRFTVSAAPLDGQPSLASPDWFKPVSYSSGPTGVGSPNTMVFEANSPARGHRWTIAIPPQEDAHGNFTNNTLKIYVPKK